MRLPTAATHTNPRETRWVCSSNQGWLHSRAPQRYYSSFSLSSGWQSGSQLSCFTTHHHPRKGRNGLVASVEVLCSNVKCPPPKAPPVEGMVMGVCPGRIYLLSEHSSSSLSLSLSDSLPLPHPHLSFSLLFLATMR